MQAIDVVRRLQGHRTFEQVRPEASERNVDALVRRLKNAAGTLGVQVVVQRLADGDLRVRYAAAVPTSARIAAAMNIPPGT